MSGGFRAQEISLPPVYWNRLSQEEKSEFQKLRAHFHQAQKVSSKDPRLISFSNELQKVLHFLEESPVTREPRTILVGVAFAGPFICVNTRQLKSFLGRCKSSINGSFQQLGYVALRTKSKARSCVLSILPALSNDLNLLRQWTVRYASCEAKFCFLSSINRSTLPQITEDDLNEDKKSTQVVRFNTTIGAMPPKTTKLEYDLLSLPTPPATPTWQDGAPAQQSAMPISYSIDCFPTANTYVNDGWGYDNDTTSEWNPMWESQSRMTRSQSASFNDDYDRPYPFFDFD